MSSKAQSLLSTALLIEMSEHFDEIFNEEISDYRADEILDSLKYVIAKHPVTCRLKLKAYRIQMLTIAIATEAEYILLANTANYYGEKICYIQCHEPTDSAQINRYIMTKAYYDNEAKRHQEASRLFRNRADHAEMLLRPA